MDYQTLELKEHEGLLTVTVNPPERSGSEHTDASLIADALSQLKTEHRVVIVRAYYRGESVAELARVLDLPQDTVKSRLYQGLRALRAALQENGGAGR